MATDELDPALRSPLAGHIGQFVQSKRACGYKFDAGLAILVRFDRALCEAGLQQCELPRSVTRAWLTRGPNESVNSQRARMGAVRQLAQYLCFLGVPAYVPDRIPCTRESSVFTARVLTRDEIRRLIDAVDHLTPNAHGPLRDVVMPEIFRLLYGCGFRAREVLRLRVDDVDLDRGIVTVRDGKFGKDRLVPPAIPLVQRLRRFTQGLGHRPGTAYFFPTDHGGAWSHTAVYQVFRELLHRVGISHCGRGKGPRLHDLRHTFAVHTLLRWCQEGADLDAKLPVLSTYLGHQSLLGTQRYLHLTAELFPQITVRSTEAFGDVIPRRLPT